MKQTSALPSAGPRALAMRVRVLSFALEREVDRALAEEGAMTLAQFMLLMPVSLHPGITQRAIATLRNLTEAAVSRQAETLCGKGYLERDRNPSKKRERALHLTDQGKRALKEATRQVDRRLGELFGEVPAQRQQEAIRSLDDLISSVGVLKALAKDCKVINESSPHHASSPR